MSDRLIQEIVGFLFVVVPFIGLLTVAALCEEIYRWNEKYKGDLLNHCYWPFKIICLFVLFISKPIIRRYLKQRNLKRINRPWIAR